MEMEEKTMDCIRPATVYDLSRIAEIYVTNYRTNFYQYFHNDAYYYGELTVTRTIEEFIPLLGCISVWDDGIVKGFVCVMDDCLDKLYVEPAFQCCGIGAELLQYAIENHQISYLWALEYNKRGIGFYERHGFHPNGEKMTEDEWVPLIKMTRQEE